MRKILYLLLAILLLGPLAEASFNPPLKDTSANADHSTGLFHLPPVKTIESYLGRKLTLREKINLAWLKYRYKKIAAADERTAKKANRNALWSYIFSIAGIFSFFLLIPAFILAKRALKQERENPGILTPQNLRHAKSAVAINTTMAIIYVAFAIIVVLIVTGTHGSCHNIR